MSCIEATKRTSLVRTAGRVAKLLRQFGCDEVAEGIGRTGVVAVLKGSVEPQSRIVGIRADMDALPIAEETGLTYASVAPGIMHACGHDGHTAILLGAVGHLAGSRNFRGTLVAIFQPAEEGGGGAREMVADGLFERFAVEEVYALHNLPGLPIGAFALNDGVLLAASDRFEIEIEGKGGHAARPHECIDPLLVGAKLVDALQTIVSRDIDPLDPSVVSVTSFHAGGAYNVIPHNAVLKGTVRTFGESSRRVAEQRLRKLSRDISAAYGAAAKLKFLSGYPATVNHPAQAHELADAAGVVSGNAQVDRSMRPIMGAEDFSFMLRERPGAFIFLGNGDSRPLHHPQYDFDDEALSVGIALWVNLVCGATDRSGSR